MRFFEHRRSNSLGAEQTGQSRERFGEARRIAERSFKEMELFEGRLGCLGFEGDGQNR